MSNATDMKRWFDIFNSTNEVILTLAGTGITCLLLFVFFKYFVLKRFKRIFSNRIFQKKLIISLIVILIFSLFFYKKENIFQTISILNPFHKIIIFVFIITFLFFYIIKKIKQSSLFIRYTEFFILFIKALYLFWMFFFMIYGYSSIYHVIVKHLAIIHKAPPFFVDVIYISMGLCILALSLFFYVLISRIIKTMQGVATEKLRNFYQNYIIVYIYGEDNADETKKAFNFLKIQSVRSGFRRRIIVLELLSLHRSVSGSIRQRAQGIYKELKLYSEPLISLRYYLSNKKYNAIREFSAIGFDDEKYLILNQLRNKNCLLRREAQIALVKLNLGSDIFDFLYDYKYYLTDYEQVMLLDSVMNKERKTIINLDKLLNSKNETVVLFGIRLVGNLGQVSDFDKIGSFLTHSNQKICGAAIDTLVKFNEPIVQSKLIKVFDCQCYENKIKILKAIEKFDVNDCFSWIIQLIENNEDFNLRLNALRCLSKVRNIKKEMLHVAFDSYDETLHKLIDLVYVN